MKSKILNMMYSKIVLTVLKLYPLGEKGFKPRGHLGQLGV